MPRANLSIRRSWNGASCSESWNPSNGGASPYLAKEARPWFGWLLACLVTLGAPLLQAQTSTTQTISLKQGWNSVYLDVDPAVPALGVVFTNLPVTRVSSYFGARTPVEFIQDPGSPGWKEEGWRTWFGPGTAEAPLTDLFEVLGGRGYLIHATADARWTVTGTPANRRVRWRSDSYTFLGFPVDPVSAPTFGAWFAGSPAHQPTARPTTFRLDAAGHWRAVERPAEKQIEAGIAYWVFSQGGSDYPGPLEVTVPQAVRGVVADFGDVNTKLIVRFRNRTESPIRVEWGLTPDNVLPVSVDLSLPGSIQRVPLPLRAQQEVGVIEGRQSLELGLILNRARMTSRTGGAVLTVRDDVGSLIRIPVTAKLP